MGENLEAFPDEIINKACMGRDSVKVCNIALKISLYCICLLSMYKYYTFIHAHRHVFFQH